MSLIDKAIIGHKLLAYRLKEKQVQQNVVDYSGISKKMIYPEISGKVPEYFCYYIHRVNNDKHNYGGGI